MNPRGPIPTPIIDLIFRESEGTLGEAEAHTLADWLRESESHLAAYVELLQLFAGLEWERGAADRSRHTPYAEADTASGFHSEDHPSLRRPNAREWRIALSPQWLALAASLLLAGYFVGMAVFVALRDDETGDGELATADRGQASEVSARQAEISDHESETDAVATLLATDNVEWSPRREAGLPPAIRKGERLQIISGLVELELAQGTRLTIEGPAKWSIDGNNNATLERGKLVAQVPRQAVGFTIDTPSLQVIDLGTEFGVQVDEAGASQVHVIRGAVTAQATSVATASSGPAPSVRLTAGESVVVDARSCKVRRQPADPERFARTAPASDAPALLAFYPLDGDAKDASGQGHHASKVSNVAFVAGYEGKAAQFSGKADSFIDLPIDASAETVPELTWGAWVRPKLPIAHPYEILSTDDVGYDRVLTIDSRRGSQSEASYRFAMFCGPKVGVLPSNGPLPIADRWTFVAAVYRQTTKTAVLYVEDHSLLKGKGGLVSEIIGQAEIGPSLRTIRVGGHPSMAGEQYVGSIDNVFVFRGALGHIQLEQIRAGGMAEFSKFSRRMFSENSQ